MIECQGKCKEHRGTIKRVEVRDIRHGKDWGLFSYCDEAIDEDIRRGLDVSIIDHVPSFQLPNAQISGGAPSDCDQSHGSPAG